jgi:hypothetical protein
VITGVVPHGLAVLGQIALLVVLPDGPIATAAEVDDLEALLAGHWARGTAEGQQRYQRQRQRQPAPLARGYRRSSRHRIDHRASAATVASQRLELVARRSSRRLARSFATAGWPKQASLRPNPPRPAFASPARHRRVRFAMSLRDPRRDKHREPRRLVRGFPTSARDRTAAAF